MEKRRKKDEGEDLKMVGWMECGEICGLGLNNDDVQTATNGEYEFLEGDGKSLYCG